MCSCHISMMFMTAFAGLTNKHSGKHRENEGLDKRHQHFYKINKYGKPD